MKQLTPILTLLLAALFISLIARLARRRFSSPTALGLALVAVAFMLTSIPSNWQARLTGGAAGDRLLTFVRELGLWGLFFLAGTRFDLKQVWQARRVSFFVAVTNLLLFTLTIVALLLWGQSGSAAITVATAIVGTSVWLPSQPLLAPENGALAAARPRNLGIALTLFSLTTLHLYAIFHALSGRAMTRTAWIVVALYEVIKLAGFFCFAYFVASRFLKQAEDRVSPIRKLLGYTGFVGLIFVLALLVVGELGALAWAFISGSLLGGSKAGTRVRESRQPVAMVVFSSFAFLPLLLQTHGRQLTDGSLILFALIAALTYKFVAILIGTRVAGISSANARQIAAINLASGEVAILVLGFSLTRWVVESDVFYGVLAFAFISMLVSPMLRWLSTILDSERNIPQATEIRCSDKSSPRRRIIASIVIVGLSVLMLVTAVRAQSPTAPENEDPVTRARARITDLVDERTAAAERALTAIKLVNESVEARKQGKHEQAKESLAKAEQVIAATGTVRNDSLAEALNLRLAEERGAFNLNPAAPSKPTTSHQFALKAPRLVVARYQTYRDTFSRILTEEQVPVELLAVAFVESGFNPQALSPKGARGIWQFMPGTAERYGLPVRPTADHRTHPEHSTRAAARYLRDLYQQFGNWKLALAAYNWGEGNLQRVINRTGLRDFDELARRGLLPLETRNYVPAVIALWEQLTASKAAKEAR
jgi:soluble lytic murein transglycosylase-like protein/Kef-type K+ transport system membrane component KefB